MLFKKSDKETIQKILSSSEGNRIQLHHLCSEISDSIRILKRLETIVEQLSNDFETLRSRMIALEHKFNSAPQKPKTEKAKTKK